MADVVMKTGDRAPDLTRTLLDGDGNPADLQGATVRFLMRRRGSRLAKVASAATNAQVIDGSDGSKGKVSYAWVAADVNEPGLFNAEWEVTFAGAKPETFPNGRYLSVLFTEGLG